MKTIQFLGGHAHAVPHQVSQPLRVFVLYESLPFGLEAVRLYRKLASDFYGRIPFSLSLWRVDLLEQGEVAETAMVEAAEASLVVLSLSHESTGNPAIVRFFQCAMRGRDPKDLAIVGLTDGGEDGLEPSEHSLLGEIKSWAKEEGLRYFEQRIPLSGSGCSRTFSAPAYSQWFRRQLENGSRPPCDNPGFGINE